MKLEIVPLSCCKKALNNGEQVFSVFSDQPALCGTCLVSLTHKLFLRAHELQRLLEVSKLGHQAACGLIRKPEGK